MRRYSSSIRSYKYLQENLQTLYVQLKILDSHIEIQYQFTSGKILVILQDTYFNNNTFILNFFLILVGMKINPLLNYLLRMEKEN